MQIFTDGKDAHFILPKPIQGMKFAYIKLDWFWFGLETTCTTCSLIFDLKTFCHFVSQKSLFHGTYVYHSFKDSLPKQKISQHKNKTTRQSPGR